MKHYFDVIGYDKQEDCHVCVSSDGKDTMNIDIMVNGDLRGFEPEELVGKKISCNYTYPYISIAMGVEVVQ